MVKHVPLLPEASLDWAPSLSPKAFPKKAHRANSMLAAPWPKHQDSLRSDHPPIRTDTQTPGTGHLTERAFVYVGRVKPLGWHI